MRALTALVVHTEPRAQVAGHQHDPCAARAGDLDAYVAQPLGLQLGGSPRRRRAGRESARTPFARHRSRRSPANRRRPSTEVHLAQVDHEIGVVESPDGVRRPRWRPSPRSKHGVAPGQRRQTSTRGGHRHGLDGSHGTLLASGAANDALPGSGAPLPSQPKLARHVRVLVVSPTRYTAEASDSRVPGTLHVRQLRATRHRMTHDSAGYACCRVVPTWTTRPPARNLVTSHSDNRGCSRGGRGRTRRRPGWIRSPSRSNNGRGDGS